MANRTSQQNRALHKAFQLLSDELNTKGLDVQKVVKAGYEIWWTPHMVKEIIWRPFQRTKTGKESSTELEKVGEIDEVWEDIMRNLGEKFGVEYIDFPNLEEGEKEGKIKINNY